MPCPQMNSAAPWSGAALLSITHVRTTVRLPALRMDVTLLLPRLTPPWLGWSRAACGLASLPLSRRWRGWEATDEQLGACPRLYQPGLVAGADPVRRKGAKTQGLAIASNQ